MSLLTSLLLLLGAARLLGQLCLRFQQPVIIGELLAGVLLGPACLNIVAPSPALSGIAELAVFLVVLSAGLEMDFRDISQLLSRRKGLLVSLLAFVIPFVCGVVMGEIFVLDLVRNLFLGVCISITALPVAVRILENLGLLRTEIARLAVAAAVLSDVAALLVLGVILDLSGNHSVGSIALSLLWSVGKLALLSACVLGLNASLEWIERKGGRIDRFLHKLVRLFGNDALLGVVIVFVLAFGSISDSLGFHFIIGAFFGALLIDRRFFLKPHYRELERGLASVTGGFLAPVFFAYIGLQFNLAGIQSLLFAGVVLAVSIGSKVLAGWAGGRLVGLVPREALGLGIILNARGIMELVVASIAYERGFIGQDLFSTLVLMGVVTTFITPLLFRHFVLDHLKLKSAAGAQSVKPVDIRCPCR